MKPVVLAWVFGVGLVGALVTIAFLVGQQSGHEQAVARVVEVGGEHRAPFEDEALEHAYAPRDPQPDPDGTPQVARDPSVGRDRAAAGIDDAQAAIERASAAGRAAASVAAPRGVQAGTPRDPASAAPSKGSQQALRAYFASLDQIQVGPGGDPQSFANELLAAAMSGESARFDELVRDLSAAESRIAALQPPPDAARHHRAMLEQLSEARALLTKVGAAIARSDPGALTMLGADAQRMQAAAETLAREDADLRKRL